SPPYSKKSSYESASFFFAYCTPRGMRSPDRGSTTGAASWTDHEHSEWAARRASEASQSPLTAIFKEKLVRKYEFFSHFICLYGSERYKNRVFLSVGFLSCLYGSELKYYTFSPLLIKQNHLIFLLPPFFILTFQHH
ncbi:hypothetical protein KZA98_03205, partial [Escherichia coli]|nr:hypothetical protein [Escherichia coli]